MMEVHSFYCDICNQEFAEPELTIIELPVWNNGDASADYYRDESLRKPYVHMKKLDICDDCLIEATVMQEVDKHKATFINKNTPCPHDAVVSIKKFASEVTTRHGKVSKKKPLERGA